MLVSHLHGDHCLDLVAYSYALRYHPEGPLPRLPIYGPVSTRHRLCGAFDDWPSDGLSDVFDFRGIRAGHRAIGPFEIELDRVRHPIEAYGMRLTAGGRTFTYSGDTGSCEEVEKLARDTDLFLCESSWAALAGQPAGHPHERPRRRRGGPSGRRPQAAADACGSLGEPAAVAG